MAGDDIAGHDVRYEQGSAGVGTSERGGPGERGWAMKFVLWLILAVLSWPLAVLALILYPVVWVLALPFRIIGISVNGVLDLLRAIFGLPGRLLGRGRSHR
jgi:hypothetical protein